MPIRYLIAAAGACILFAFVTGYHTGAKSVKTDMAERAAAQVEDARRQEKAARAKLDAITENYLHEIEEYKKTINAYSDVDINSLSDTRACPGSVPRKAENKPGFICYTPAELQSKIEASLDIAAECDELAIRYKALIESCK